jgi:hypothetical protein
VKLPNIEQAFVEEEKITGYLLSETHSGGREKQAFFSRFGFSVAEWEVMAEALIQHAQDHEVVREISAVHGTKYVIEGALLTPDERNPTVRTVWIIDTGETAARLVTAYPLKE